MDEFRILRAFPGGVRRHRFAQAGADHHQLLRRIEADPAAALMSQELIFVYGTLRAGTANALGLDLAACWEFVEEGVMQGRLYEIDGYPVAVLSTGADHRVWGELYRIRDRERLFACLDEYEGCAADSPQPCEYLRQRVRILPKSGGEVIAWAYLYNQSVTGLREIVGGDYLGQGPLIDS